jgi:hypothetical protein
MTEHLDDATLSDVLDGVGAPPGDHLATCADCRRRLDALRQAAAAVAAAPPPVPDAVRDRHIAAALAAMAAAPPTGAPARRAPALRRRWWKVAAGLAAAAAAAGLVLPLTRRGGDTGQLAGKEAERAGPAVAAAGAPLDLGAVDAASLPAALASRLPPPGAAPVPPAPAALRCEAALRASTPGVGPLLLAATATWEGRPAVVLAFGARPGPVVAYVTAAADCGILHFARLP